MYAAGRIPGSFFRREGRPSEDAILTCRLIDRPLRPSFAKGLRNEVQVVETVLALDPAHPYDVVAINAASMSTKLSGLPFCGPVGATRVAHIDGQWVAFPTHEELARATFDMVVAGRALADGDVAIMMVEAEATEHTHRADRGRCRRRRPRRSSRAASRPPSRPSASSAARRASWPTIAAKPVAEFPVFLEYQDDVLRGRRRAARGEIAEALKIVSKADREDALDRIKDARHRRARPASSRVARRRSAARSARSPRRRCAPGSSATRSASTAVARATSVR